MQLRIPNISEKFRLSLRALKQLRFNLSQKTLALVLIPLGFELAFVGILSFLLWQTEIEAQRALHSSKVSDSINKIMRDLFEIGSITKGDALAALSGNAYQNEIAQVRQHIEELKEAVKDNDNQKLIVDSSSEAAEQAYRELERLRGLLDSGGLTVAIHELRMSKVILRGLIKKIISPELVSMAQKEKEIEDRAPTIQAGIRNQIKFALALGVVFNVLLSLSVAWVLGEQIVRRLDVMVENSFRLAAERPLNPPVGGGDEIEMLDHSFRKMAQSLIDAQKKERAQTENAVDIICALDHAGKIVKINPACNNITGFTEEELRGHNLRHILSAEDIEVLKRSLTAGAEEQAEVKFESQIKHKEGKEVYVSWSMVWVPSERTFFCVGHDITARKEIEQLKQAFMAMVSHDLRTPLATISNYLEMLETGMFGELTERGGVLLKVAESNAQRMASLINDLLDLEKAESGRLELEQSQHALAELLDLASQSVSSLASREEVRLEISDTDLSVFVDAKRIQQVLVNLLSNAIKFSPKGGTIKISADRQAKFAAIHISDQGRGVPDSMKSAIFERFQQVRISDAVDKGGSGLGLAICKTIVDLHGGQIGVMDNIDQGSTFSFTVPLVEDSRLKSQTDSAII
jgi:PAS domain S-box-containing protein